jgi:hypothetical protein
MTRAEESMKEVMSKDDKNAEQHGLIEMIY